MDIAAIIAGIMALVSSQLGGIPAELPINPNISHQIAEFVDFDDWDDWGDDDWDYDDDWDDDWDD